MASFTTLSLSLSSSISNHDIIEENNNFLMSPKDSNKSISENISPLNINFEKDDNIHENNLSLKSGEIKISHSISDKSDESTNKSIDPLNYSSKITSLSDKYNNKLSSNILINKKIKSNFIESLNSDNENSVDHDSLSNTSGDLSEQYLISDKFKESPDNNKILKISNTEMTTTIKCNSKKEPSNITKSCNEINIKKFHRTRSSSTGNLTWTEWIIQKAEKSIHQNEINLKKKQELKEIERIKNANRLAKRAQCEKNFKDWSKKYDEELLERMKEKEDKLIKEMMAKEMEQLNTKERANKKYMEWLDKKREEKKLKIEEERLLKEKLETEKKLKEKKNKEAFDNWLKISKNRPKSSCQSYAIACGRKITYYDWGSCSQPSYKNPKKWIMD